MPMKKSFAIIGILIAIIIVLANRSVLAGITKIEGKPLPGISRQKKGDDTIKPPQTSQTPEPKSTQDTYYHTNRPPVVRETYRPALAPIVIPSPPTVQAEVITPEQSRNYFFGGFLALIVILAGGFALKKLADMARRDF